MTGWGVHRLADMVGPANCRTDYGDGRWVRAVPLPYAPTIRERILCAWEVLRGRAHAIHWPEAGDLEKALRRGEEAVRPAQPEPQACSAGGPI